MTAVKFIALILMVLGSLSLVVVLGMIYVICLPFIAIGHRIERLLAP